MLSVHVHLTELPAAYFTWREFTTYDIVNMRQNYPLDNSTVRRN